MLVDLENNMEEQLSEILDNLLGMLLLEGSYEIEEADNSFLVSIETKDAGRLIGARGESLDSLQLLVNQMMLKKLGAEQSKRVVIDVEGWKKQKEQDLVSSAKAWGQQVLESKKDFELEPLPAWQRRIVHMTIEEMDGVESESVGEGRDRHIVIKIKNPASQAKRGEQKSKIKSEESDDNAEES